MSEAAYDEAKRRQRVAEAIIATFTPQQKAEYDNHLLEIGPSGSLYDWPGWADFPAFLDPRDGWSR